MRLKKLTFTEYAGTAQEWTIDGFVLGQRNLLVGRNASGKTRSLNIINGLAHYLSGLKSPGLASTYEVIFQADGKTIEYILEMGEQSVLREVVKVDGTLLLDRREGGIGLIWAEKIGVGQMIPFQAPPSDVAAVTRRDAVQHSFLEPLHAWASSTRFYQFSTPMGKDKLTLLVPNAPQVDDRDQSATTGVFRKGDKEFGKDFVNGVITDMGKIGYHLTEIGVGLPVSVKFLDAPGEPLGIFVKESDHPSIVDQFSMSTGMYRVLALLIHVNYFERKKSASCVLVDDIGEGIDFSRSCRLVHLLREKAEKFDIQLVMSTNDKFVMNEVPLEEWSIMERDANHVHVRNYENSKDVMDDFKFTGLGNFAFLEMDVINEPYEHDGR